MWIIPSTETLFTFRKHYFVSLQVNISFHTIRLIHCSQQTGEIDNLTVSWGKIVWLCCVQVPRCCWHRHRTINSLLVPASNNLQKWFLSPTGRLNFGFILRKTYCCSYHTFLLGFLNGSFETSRLFSGAVAKEKEDFYKGSLSLPISLLCYCFS
jgi:hypothetical protein